MNSGGRRVAVAATLLGLPVLLIASALWWRSLGVEIEIVPDREVWQPGETITGKIMVHNRTFREFKIDQGQLGYIHPLDSGGGRVHRSGWLENEYVRWEESPPPGIHMARRSSVVEDDFEISTDPWEHGGGYWMPNGEFLISLDQEKVEEFSRELKVSIKISPARVKIRGDPSKKHFGGRVIRFAVCPARIVCLMDDGAIESRERESGRLLTRTKLDDGWFEDYLWFLDPDQDLACSNDGVWIAALRGWELKLRRIDGASNAEVVSIPLPGHEPEDFPVPIGFDPKRERFFVAASGMLHEIDPASRAVTTRRADPPEQAPRPLPGWFRQIDGCIHLFTEKK